MGSIADMNKHVAKKLGDKLAKFCSPLVDHLAVNHFYHFAIIDTGHYAAVGLHQEWQECIHSSEEIDRAVPNFYHNRDALKGIIFTQTIPNKHWQSLAKEGSERYNIHTGHGVSHGVITGSSRGQAWHSGICHLALSTTMFP